MTTSTSSTEIPNPFGEDETDDFDDSDSTDESFESLAEQKTDSESSEEDDYYNNINIPKPVLTKTAKQYQKIIYDYCRQYYPNLIEMARVFYKRALNLYDNHISVEGGTGSGKSMLTFILVHLQHHLMDKTFNLERQTLFIPDQGELKREMKQLKDLDVYWLDEAIRALDKKQWYKLDQIEMNHIVKTERWKRNTVYYNIQRFHELTESFRNDNIFFRVFVVKRFGCILYVKDDDKDVEDAWHIKENLSIKFRNWKGVFKYNVTRSAEEIMESEKKLPNAFISSRFPNVKDIPECLEYWNYYEWLKQQSRNLSRQKEKEAAKKNGSGRVSKYDMLWKQRLAASVVNQLNTGAYDSMKSLWNKHYKDVVCYGDFRKLIELSPTKLKVRLKASVGQRLELNRSYNPEPSKPTLEANSKDIVEPIDCKPDIGNSNETNDSLFSADITNLLGEEVVSLAK